MHRSFSIRIGILVTTLFVGAFTVNAQVVISQIFAGGFPADGTYGNDYVELLNTSGTDYNLTGHSLQYGNRSTGNLGNAAAVIYAFPANTIIPAKRYLLVKCGTVNASRPAVPSPDLSAPNGILDIPQGGGKLALCNVATGLNKGATDNPLPLPDSRVLDLVGWNCNLAEGGTSIPTGATLASTAVLVRKNAGQQDTDNNVNDFDILAATNPAATPRNLTSPMVPVTLSGFTLE